MAGLCLLCVRAYWDTSSQSFQMSGLMKKAPETPKPFGVAPKEMLELLPEVLWVWSVRAGCASPPLASPLCGYSFLKFI